MAGFFALIWSNLCTRHIPGKLTPRGHHDWPDKLRNVYEVTEEFCVHNGQYGTREDVVFLVNGIPVLAHVCVLAS